jgi:hypothetical protein
MTRRSVTTAVAAAAVAGTTLALLAHPAQASSMTQPRVATTKNAQAVAVAAADRAVSSGVDSLVKSGSETYQRTSVTPWVDNLFSVGYERT